jgi:signal transduction histidine kinase
VERHVLTARNKIWALTVVGCLAAQALAALVMRQSYFLTALSDIIQCLLLLSGTICFIPLARRSEGRLRLFWTLMALGIAFWLSYQILWTYFEVVLRKDVPDIFSGDVVLFLHIVPLMAALGLRPHVPPDEYAARIGRLDFALLLTWWLYLYALLVLPWQYAVIDIDSYNRDFNSVYLAEKLVFLGALAACWMGGNRSWRIFYGNLFGASLIYAASSYSANWALARDSYYSGSLYDIPLATSMAWVNLIGLWADVREPAPETRKTSTAYGVWVARGGMIAVFSLPIFAAWTLLDSSIPAGTRGFRLVLTLSAALAMGIMVFLRQHMLDRELIRLLNYSRESFENLKRLQDQIVQQEKLASIGQLVGGAAHELNNPITAMLGYSDLLLNTQLTADQNSLAARIGQQVRRTKSLVASLLAFAKRAPASKNPIDLNTLARTAVKLTEPQWQAMKMEVRLELESSLPKVLGDSNQLIQVCLQMLGNALHAMDERGGRILTVSSRSETGLAVLEIAEDVPAGGFDSRAENENSLGMSACQGILQEHQGRIVRINRHDGGTVFRIELPFASAQPGKAKALTGPEMWQSQPFS